MTDKTPYSLELAGRYVGMDFEELLSELHHDPRLIMADEEWNAPEHPMSIVDAEDKLLHYVEMQDRGLSVERERRSALAWARMLLMGARKEQARIYREVIEQGGVWGVDHEDPDKSEWRPIKASEMAYQYARAASGIEQFVQLVAIFEEAHEEVVLHIRTRGAQQNGLQSATRAIATVAAGPELRSA